MKADIVGYIISKLGCTHPFRVSRILALAELERLENGKGRITNFRYVRGPNVFYIEGLKELIEKDSCFVIREDQGCVEYVCKTPTINEDVKKYLDKAINAAKKLDDYSLNNVVVKHAFYEELFRG